MAPPGGYLGWGGAGGLVGLPPLFCFRILRSISVALAMVVRLVMLKSGDPKSPGRLLAQTDTHHP